MAGKNKNMYDELFSGLGKDDDDLSSERRERSLREDRRERKTIKIKEVLIEKVHRNENNLFSLPRDERFWDLVKGVEQMGGSIDDPICQPADEEGCYDLISGERRWLAQKEAGFEKIRIKILPERVTGSEEMVRIMNANLGGRKENAYDIPRSLKRYYELLHEEGITDKDEKKKLALEKLNISSERTFRNYHILSELPMEMLDIASEGLLTRDEGISLATGYISPEYQQFAIDAIDAIKDVYASDESMAVKKNRCKEIVNNLEYQIKRKNVREAKKKNKPSALAVIKKMTKPTSMEYEIPEKKKEREKALQMIEMNMSFLEKIKTEIESYEE